MKLSFQQIYQGGGTRRVATVITDKNKTPVEIFFEIPSEHLPMPRVLDGFVIGIIFYAMRLGEDIHVAGSISRELLPNLRAYQEAWSMWRPGVYHRVTITADTLLDIEPAQPMRAISAYSGGVDSTFAVLRHCWQHRTAASYPLDGPLVLVDGFDVPLSKPEQFTALKNRVEPLARELGMIIKTVRTNLKELILQDWHESCVPQLAACLHNFSHEYAYALIGGAKAYDGLVFPSAQSPATDHLLSGGAMSIIHEGAGYSRTDKVALIAKHPTALQTLKVCWEGPDPTRNCGTCEKCVRTQINFLAVGVTHAPCFDRPLPLRAISNVPLSHNLKRVEMAAIVTYAKRNQIEGRWLELLEARLRKYRPPTKLEKKWIVLKPKLKKLLYAVASCDVALITGKIKKDLAAWRRG